MSVVIVHNRIKDGYRRAGLSLSKGENRFETLSAAQLAALKGDPRLSVVEADKDGSKGLHQERADNETHKVVDGVSPANLTVEQLKTKLAELNIEFKASANKAELVALLEQALKGVE